MLRPAHWPVDPWLRRDMVDPSWAIRSVSSRDPRCRRGRVGLGMGSYLAPATMRTAASSFGYRVGRSRVMRLRNSGVVTALGKFGKQVHVGLMEIDPMKNKLLALGIGGTILAVLCCFTPLLPIVLTALGLTRLLGVVYNDAVLLPMLATFLILTGHALWPQRKQK